MRKLHNISYARSTFRELTIRNVENTERPV